MHHDYLSMNSQNQYHLSFNPRGQPKQKPGQKQIRYIPQLKQNRLLNPPWRQAANNEYPDQPIRQPQPTPETREFKIPLSPNDSGYMSNKSSYSTAKRAEQKRQEQRKKEEIIKRVKDLQEKVLPMVERDRADDEQTLQTGWQSKIQLKLIRIETCLDGIRKQWEVEMQKKLAEMENVWESRFEEIVSRNEGY